jgi:hypothetical protein
MVGKTGIKNNKSNKNLLSSGSEMAKPIRYPEQFKISPLLTNKTFSRTLIHFFGIFKQKRN